MSEDHGTADDGPLTSLFHRGLEGSLLLSMLTTLPSYNGQISTVWAEELQLQLRNMPSKRLLLCVFLTGRSQSPWLES